MDKDKIVDELNSCCEYVGIGPYWGDHFKWTWDDVDIENDRSRSYIAQVQGLTGDTKIKRDFWTVMN